MTALVFLDFETTGLTTDDEPWEFAAVRREPYGPEQSWHAFLTHDTAKAERLPMEFQDDHALRYDPMQAMDPLGFAEWVQLLFRGRPHVVGAVPDFDARHLRKMLGTNGFTDPWHYHLIDVETLAVGYLEGVAAAGRAEVDESITSGIALPWDSDDLSRALGVEPPGDGVRHTAMGDVRWTMQLWDAVMGGPS